MASVEHSLKEPAPIRSDYVALTEIGDRNITLNVCGPVVGETWKIEEPNQVAGYFRGAHSDISVG